MTRLSGAGRLLVLAGAAAVLAVGTVLGSLATTGELVPTVLLDPGAVTRYGLPIARTLHTIAAALAIGTAVFACYVLPGSRDVNGVVGFHQWRAAKWAAAAACWWAAMAVTVMVFTASSATGIPVTDPAFGEQLAFYVLNLERGQAQALSLALIIGSSLMLLAPRGLNRLGWGAGLAVAALLPLAVTGHAAGADEHANAVNSLGMHLVGATIWVGGLMALIALVPRITEELGEVVGRYSTVALGAFVLVVVSGVINAWLRLDSPSDLVQHPYGRLLLIKVVLTVLFGWCGWYYRSRLIRRLDGELSQSSQPPKSSPRGVFVRLITAEVLLMAVVFGLSAGLAASAPPVAQDPVTYDPRHALLGYPFPEPMTVQAFMSSIQPDWVAAFVIAVAAGGYLLGVRRLRKRGVEWPMMRTVSWLAGCLSLMYFTSGGPAVYGKVHFSAHMIQHMGLMMYAPLLLVMGAPVLLALRSIRPRGDGSRGVREWLLVVLHSRYSWFITRPGVAAAVFALSLVAFYFTGWFEWSLAEHTGHMVMMVHFVISGYLFFWVILGSDPGPARPPHLIRILVLLVTMAFHALFGIAIMAANTPLAPRWWSRLGFEDQGALLADQALGGAIAWGAGEVPVVIAALIVAVQWSRSDARTARREDRRAARDNDAELRAYNDQLARLAQRSERSNQSKGE